MEWKDISSTIGKIAPALGALLAIPTGGASMAIGEAIAAVLGSDSTPEAVAAAVANNPDAALKLQAMENDHKQVMERLSLEKFQTEVADRGTARSREVEINKTESSSWLSKNVSSLLAIGCLVLTFLMFYQVLYKTIDPAKQEIVVYILGALSAISTQIISYYFGSSMGSKAKTEMFGKV